MLYEPKFRAPRVWSNTILAKIAPHLRGNVVNVSGWRDEDKEGGKYRDYFTRATSYAITNAATEERGKGSEGEIYLDLVEELPDYLREKYDVVFNHTTLEHIFEVERAFANLCALSKDVVVLVVPWLQELHYNRGYSDYWRFSPFAILELFKCQNMSLEFIDWNEGSNKSVYIVAVAVRNSDRWRGVFSWGKRLDFGKIECGNMVVRESWLGKLFRRIKWRGGS